MNPGSSGWRPRDARTDYERHHRGPNMTPMVDVVMVILIFFMASTVILGPELLLAAGLEPAEDAGTPAEADPRFAIEAPDFEIAIGVGRAGVAVTGLGIVEGTLGSFARAAARLADDAGTEGLRMVLVPADDVPYEAVIRVQDTLRNAGFRSVGLR